MNKETIKNMFKKLGFDFKEKEKELDNELDQLLNDSNKSFEPAKIDTSKFDPETKKMFEAVINQNQAMMNAIKTLQEALAEEKKTREQIIKNEQDRLAKEKETKIKSAVEKLLSEKKITDADKDTWQALYNSDFEKADKAAQLLKPLVDNKHSQNNQQQKPDPKTADNPILKTILERNEILN